MPREGAPITITRGKKSQLGLADDTTRRMKCSGQEATDPDLITGPVFHVKVLVNRNLLALSRTQSDASFMITEEKPWLTDI